jgi:serine protease Do
MDRAGTQGAAGARRLLPLLLFLAGIAVGGVIWLVLQSRGGSGETGSETVTSPVSTPASGRPDSSSPGELTPSRVPEEIPPSLRVDSITEGRRNAVVRAAETVGPSVVSISVIQSRYVRAPVPADPFGFFDRYLPGTVYRERVPSLGSGFLIDRAGVILTNEHVVHAAEQVKVTLTDGRTFDAEIIGSDPNYDLAVLRIEGQDLPVAPLGDSDDILVGEWAIAIGNPFGFLLNDYQPSVTVGVISAYHRDIKPSTGTSGIYKDMIQTDAAINPGNSGGPLVNGEGKVIGINTFIFTESGGSLGIGFAIPIEVAVRVVREILQFGAVRQVWTGIAVRPISPYIAAYYNITNTRGLLVWELEEGSPADRAGVEVGDIIRKVNGEEVWTREQASRLIFGAAVGDVITLAIERGGSPREIRVRLEAHPGQQGVQG